ncbi:MAG TPA: copper resistance protein CopC [Gaiellaceae bacterium]|nr:copper resistance protein CopC [Gaiellaceae bacterium]
MRRVLVIAVLVALAAPAAAFGHASIRDSKPASRQRLERAPAQVELDFDQAVKVFPGGIKVFGVRGHDYVLGVHLESGGHAVVASVAHLPTGAYTVRWQALSGDGHVVSGVYTFGVRVAAPPPTDAYGSSGPTTTENVLRWLYFVCLALVIGGVAFRLVVLPRTVPRAFERVFYWLTLGGVAAGIQIGCIAFLLRAEDALQLPFSRFLYGDLTPFADGTRFGEAFVVMTLGFAIVTALLFLAWLTDRPRPFLWPALAVSLVLASGLSLSGHSAFDPPTSKWSELADWVHLSAASLWAGGVVMLLTVFLTAPALRRAAFVRFARVAPVLIALLLAAGIYLSVLRLPALSDLWSSGYGHVLLIKLALVGVALAWGGVHHFLVEPRLGRPGVQSRVRGSLAGEMSVGLAVLLVAAFLVNSKPPARSAPRTQATAATLAARR